MRAATSPSLARRGSERSEGARLPPSGPPRFARSPFWLPPHLARSSARRPHPPRSPRSPLLLLILLLPPPRRRSPSPPPRAPPLRSEPLLTQTAPPLRSEPLLPTTLLWTTSSTASRPPRITERGLPKQRRWGRQGCLYNLPSRLQPPTRSPLSPNCSVRSCRWKGSWTSERSEGARRARPQGQSDSQPGRKKGLRAERRSQKGLRAKRRSPP